MIDPLDRVASAVPAAQNAMDCFAEEEQCRAMSRGAGVIEGEIVAAAAEWRRQPEELRVGYLQDRLSDVDSPTLAGLIAFPCVPVRRMALAELARRRRPR